MSETFLHCFQSIDPQWFHVGFHALGQSTVRGSFLKAVNQSDRGFD